MSTDWMAGVSMIPSLQTAQRTSSLSVKGPVLKTRQTNLINKWWEQDRATQPLCDRDSILARHDDELFEPSAMASHIFDSIGSPETEPTTCELCRLIVKLPAYRLGDSYALYVKNILDDKERYMALDYPPKHFVMGLAVSEHNANRQRREGLGYLPPPMEGLQRENLLVPIETKGVLDEDVGSPFQARPLDPAQVNLDYAKTWIEDCSTSHPACHASTGDLFGIVDVIDCESQKIVPIPKNAEYLALSYVWGPQPVQADTPESSKRSKLTEVPADVPRTIVDAIAVTRALAYRYLWVDRYCIDQNDPVTKVFQLSLMDEIYESAEVTLVAASGVDDMSGLPGAGTLPLISRESQPSAWIGNHRVAQVGPGILTTVQQSKWASRAWTFQEGYLSTRCLIFGPKQMQFLCKTTCRHETMPRVPKLSEHDLSSEINIMSVFGRGTAGLNNRHNSDMTVLESFQFVANEFLRRDIKFESDTLDAFRGILKGVEYFTFFGIPLVTRQGRELQHPDVNDSSSTESTNPRPRDPQIATAEDSKRIIALSPLNLTRKRRRPNLFHAGRWFHYPYDEIPGPGEPLQPSPTLGFLYGLTWTTHPRKDNPVPENLKLKLTRRTDMPSWSWLSLQSRPFSYQPDFADPTELECDVLLNLHNDIQVWAQQKSDVSGHWNWLPLDEAWARSTSKIIPESGRHIKLETQTGDITSLSITREQYGNKDWKYNIELATSLPVDGSERGNELDVQLDNAKADVQDFREGEFLDLNWKVALVRSMTYYNPKHEAAWQDAEPSREFLVLMPCEGVWMRVGVMSLSFGNATVLDLKRESLILC